VSSTQGPGVKPAAGGTRRWTTKVLGWGGQGEKEKRKHHTLSQTKFSHGNRGKSLASLSHALQKREALNQSVR